MYMRANSRSDMARAVGAKAAASVGMAVPPTLAAGSRSVQSVSESESATSGDDLQEGEPEG